MKRIILITIICFLFPCFGFAQGPVTISSIEGTLWRGQCKTVSVSLNPFEIEAFNGTEEMGGVSDGKMYHCHIIDGDTCTPEEVPEEFNVVINCSIWLQNQ